MTGLETSHLPGALHAYAIRVGVRAPEVLRRLRAETADMASAGMQISPDQGQLMALPVKLLAMNRILEIGGFTGYSSLVMALALPADGRIHDDPRVDISPAPIGDGLMACRKRA